MRTPFFPLILVAALALTPPVRAAENNTVHPSYSQTIQGVTIRLTDVHWSPFDVKNPLFPYLKMFYFNYVVQAGPGVAKPPPGKSLLDCVTGVTAIAPDGSELGDGGGGYSSGPSGEKLTASVYRQDVDPRWPMVSINMDFVDPAAPPKASGLSTAPITIAGIPVPTQMDTATLVHAETVTPLGTHIIVEKIKVSPDVMGIKTWVVFRVVPDPAIPDLQFRCSTGGKLADEAGPVISPYGASIANADQLDNTPRTTNGRDWTIGFVNAPAPTVKTLRLTLSATESSEKLKQGAWYRHFHFRIPLGTLWAGDRSNRASLETVEGKNVEATLDVLAPAWGRYRARLILHDRTDPTIFWRAHAVRAKDDAGNALVGQTSSDAFFWRADGEPLGPEDTACETMLGMPGSPYDSYGSKPALPTKILTVEADTEAYRVHSHVMDFPRIPVPAPGQTLILNRRVTDEFGAHLVLRKVTAYSPLHPLPTDFPNPYHLSSAPSGLAVVLAEPPDPGGAIYFDYRLAAATDQMGRRMRLSSHLPDTGGDDQGTAADKPPRVMIFLLEAPPAGVTTFSLRLGRDETILLGRTETLDFPPVPAPVLPPPNKPN